MRKIISTSIIGFTTAIFLLSATVANAAVYKFSFNSFDAELSATGEIIVNGAGEVTGALGAISGLTNQTIGGVVSNPTSPSPAYSPDGLFIYNNMYYGAGAPLDINGLLFATAQNPGGYWNLWAASPGNYSLWESFGGSGYPIQESGTLSVTAAPEASTWAMLALGFAALGLVGRRKSRAPRLAPGLG